MSVLAYYSHYGYGYGYYYDPTYILIIIGVLLCGVASVRMNATFRKYSQIRSFSGLTGAQAAEKILNSAGIYGVRVERIRGNLTDHYDPSAKVLRLSDSVYGHTSIAALGVAAHECGHAIQDKEEYAPLKIRGALVPVANIGSSLSWVLILAGLIFSSGTGLFLIRMGILFFAAAVAFQLITLPVEFDASNRAVKILGNTGILGDQELDGTKKVLRAAALTYVAGALSSILQLLRLVMLFGGGRDRD